MGERLRLTSDVEWRVATLEDVRSRIAGIILGDPPGARRFGSITLHSHQVSALQRVNDAIDRFNGALLCDEVGMGKTYVAIAVARRFARCLVVAPASLASMWRSALATTDSKADILTFEALSRSDADDYRRVRAPGAVNPDCSPKVPETDRTSGSYELVIVDEAHHTRNPRTNRYLSLEQLTRDARVLLLSATPIHNRRHDLVALLSLFLGSRAHVMTSTELAECVVRRQQEQVEDSVRIPALRPIVSHEVSDDSAVVEMLMSLPPPVPLRDGGGAGALIGRSLIHQWASSEAALREAVRRRIARATALCLSLEAGTYPTRAELETWVYGDGALQLGFAELLSSPVVSQKELLGGVRSHLLALQTVQAGFSAPMSIDAGRAAIVEAIRSTGGQIVAFAQYAETVSMLYRRLVNKGHVAMLTSHGARVAGGSLTRNEAIARFAPVATRSSQPPAADAIRLLLTTDLLSEGVNLQDADTVVHLDIPWTAARMEQRVGRVARLGSQHPEVDVHVIRPPASATTVLRSESAVQRKWALARSNVGTSCGGPLPALSIEPPREAVPESIPHKFERLREILKTWRLDLPAITNHAAGSTEPAVTRFPPPSSRFPLSPDSAPVVAAAGSDTSGFIAAISVDGRPQLLVCSGSHLSIELDDQLRMCARPQSSDAPIDPREISDALQRIRNWFLTQRAASAAGVNASAALRRRELTARIDSLIESAPPHRRNARLGLAARARRVVTTSQCAAVEHELEGLLRATLSDDDWLAAVADIDTQQASTSSSQESPRIHAVLLLTVRPRRSQSPPARESP
ncbi:MAG TPA: helicase-related protein [Gemmatimonadaceae bacterium]